MTRNERWILSEWRVAVDRAERFGERLIAHRLKTPFAEVDLLFSHGSALRLIEVKSAALECASALLKARQRTKLENAAFFLQTRYGCELEMILAVVERDSRIHYFDWC